MLGTKIGPCFELNGGEDLGRKGNKECSVGWNALSGGIMAETYGVLRDLVIFSRSQGKYRMGFFPFCASVCIAQWGASCLPRWKNFVGHHLQRKVLKRENLRQEFSLPTLQFYVPCAVQKIQGIWKERNNRFSILKNKKKETQLEVFQLVWCGR